MSVFYTSERLIDSVKRRITIPTNQNTYTDADILAFADEELMLSLVPAILSLHEDYLLFSQDTPLQAGINEYVLPYRAVGNKLYDLQFVDSNHNILSMSRTTVADETSYNGAYTTNLTYAYSIMNNRVRLLPTFTGPSSGSLRFIYYIRPSALVPSNEIAVVTNIDPVTGIISVNAVPEAFSVTGKCDFYKAVSPNNILSIDKMPIAINTATKTITFTPTDIPSELAVGDHVSLAAQCNIPQIPSDLHVFLAQKTAERILEAQGDLEGLKMAQAKSAEMEVRSGNIIDNRVDESPPKLVNRHGILRSGLIQRLYRRRG